MEEMYERFEKMSAAEARNFLQSLPVDTLSQFLVYVMNKTGLVLSDIMNSLGIWKL